ncbi:MAG TPA: ABC transporter permease [Bryobacteraceae bacterium]
MTGKIVLENLKHKPMRSLLSVLLIGVPVTLILTLVGLSYGMTEDAKRRARGIGADIVVRGSNTSSALTASGATLPEGLVKKFFESKPHVKLAMGMVAHPIELPLTVTGVDWDRLERMSGGIKFLAGGPFQDPRDIIFDQYYAAQRKARVGDTVTVMNRPWRLAGIIEGGQLSHIFVPIGTLQDLDGVSGKLSQIYLKLDDPKYIDAVLQELKKELPNYTIWSVEEWTSLLSVNTIPGLSVFTYVIIVIGVVIGFAVVCLSMYMAVLQRTREIGILKSLGGSNGFILRIILLEAVILGLGGAALGILMSFGARYLIRVFVPASIQMDIVYLWWPRAAAITLTAALLGALYPGLSAARHDPIEALAYE